MHFANLWVGILTLAFLPLAPLFGQSASSQPSIRQDAEPAPPPPSAPWSGPATKQSYELLLGEQVFWKDAAKAKVADEEIDKYKLLPWPAAVQDVRGEWLWLGRAWIKRADVMQLDEALDFYQAEVRRNPKSARAWSRRASCWRLKGELEKAIQDCDQAILLDPEEPIPYITRGNSLHDKQEYVEAIRDYDQAIRLDRKNAWVYINRGNARQALRHFEAAISDYTSALSLDDQTATAFMNRGWAEHQVGQFEAALKDYDEAARLSPQDKLPRINKAFLLATCPQEALRDAALSASLAGQVVAKDPTNPYALNALSCAFALAEDFEKAIAWQEKAMEDPAWRANPDPDGGKFAEERIAAWREGKAWHAPILTSESAAIVNEESPPAKDKRQKGVSSDAEAQTDQSKVSEPVAKF